MTFKKTAGEFIFNIAQKAFKGGKQKTTGTEVIKSVPIAKNLKRKKKLKMIWLKVLTRLYLVLVIKLK